MNMEPYRLLATHNSGTGERSASVLNSLIAPFARCQSKTLAQQVDANVTYFDIRVAFDKQGNLILAHGLWRSSVTLPEALSMLDRQWSKKAQTSEGYRSLFPYLKVSITYEAGDLDSLIEYDGFVRLVQAYTPEHIYVCSINVKKPKWRPLRSYYAVSVIRDFEVLEKGNWRRFIPIPKLWDIVRGKRITRHKPSLGNTYIMQDFV